jgi:ABC-2 type transport system permease protein
MNTIHFQRVWAMMLRHLFAWPRDLNNLVDCFWWPSFDLFVWGLTSSYVQEQGGGSEYLAFIVSGLILWVIVYRSQQEMGIGFIKEAWDRNMLNLVSSPLMPSEHFLALIFLSLIKLAVTVLWMVILSYTLFAFNFFSLGWPLGLFIISLLLSGWAAGFFINGLIIRYGYRIESFAWMLIVVIMPFSGVFYPTANMPSWMQAVARLLPTSYMFEGMRAAMRGAAIQPEALGISYGLNILYLALGILFYRFCYRKALESGMILKLG